MRPALLFLLRLAVSLGSLFFLAHSVEWGAVALAIAGIQFRWALLALAIFLAAQMVSSMRCVYITRALGGTLDFSTSLRAHFVGLWFNQVLPTSLGGDIVKTALLSRRLGFNLAWRSAFLDRFSGFAFLMLAVGLTLPLYSRLLWNMPQLVGGLASLFAIFMTAMVVILNLTERLRLRIGQVPIAREVVQVIADIRSCLRRRGIWEQFWTSAIVHFNGIAAFGLLALANGAHVDVLAFALLVPVLFLVSLLPISFAGWGVREAGAVWLFGIVGVPKETALAISICFGFMLVIGGLPGLLMFMKHSVSAVETAR